jgi:hypothetical protein
VICAGNGTAGRERATERTGNDVLFPGNNLAFQETTHSPSKMRHSLLSRTLRKAQRAALPQPRASPWDRMRRKDSSFYFTGSRTMRKPASS